MSSDPLLRVLRKGIDTPTAFQPKKPKNPKKSKTSQDGKMIRGYDSAVNGASNHYSVEQNMRWIDSIAFALVAWAYIAGAIGLTPQKYFAAKETKDRQRIERQAELMVEEAKRQLTREGQ